MKKTLFLGAILGAALCGNAFAAFNCEQIITKTDSLTLGATTAWTAGKTDEEVILTIDLTALSNVASGQTPGLLTVVGNNTPWGLRAKEGGDVTGNWNNGNMNAPKHIRGGRKNVRAAMYMAGIAIRRCKKGAVKDFYLRLKAEGKPQKLIAIACARKILTRLNAAARCMQQQRASAA